MNKIDIKQITCASITALLLASCASDDMMDGTVQDLPEGKYPLQIASVSLTAESSAQPWGVNAPQTRVSENPTDGSSSVWDGEETIAVKLDGTSGTGAYKINTDGTTSVETQTYWSKTTDNVTAWYPNETSINLADQSQNLVYMMKATASDANYKSDVNLDFKHQLAKIRVLLTGTADMQGGTVQVKGYTTGTISNGYVRGSDEGWITMKKCSYSDGNVCYEANVIPGVTLSDAAFQITAQNGTPTPLKLDAPLSVSDGGKIYEVTLTVNNSGTKTIDLTDAPIDENFEYAVGENVSVVIDGKSTPLGTRRITIDNGAHVVLKNVKLTAPEAVHVIEVKGNVTITLSGDNEIIGGPQNGNCPIAITQAGATLTINGTVNDKLTLTARSGHAVGLGASNKANLVINGGTIIATGGSGGAAIGGSGRLECGNITINGGDITAYGGENSAAIGSGVWQRADTEHGEEEYVGNCGNITINGGKIVAQGNDSGYSSSGIGSGQMSTCGFIKIAGGNITATAGIGEYGGAGIGSTVFGTCGNITITGGTITATGKRGTTLESGTYNSGAGIGAGAAGTCGSINISGANTFVTATAGDGSDAIGYGYSPDPNQPSPSGTVTIAPEAKANVTAINGKIHGN